MRARTRPRGETQSRFGRRLASRRRVRARNGLRQRRNHVQHGEFGHGPSALRGRLFRPDGGGVVRRDDLQQRLQLRWILRYWVHGRLQWPGTAKNQFKITFESLKFKFLSFSEHSIEARFNQPILSPFHIFFNFEPFCAFLYICSC